MSYLKLIQDRVQQLLEDMYSTLKVDVTVVDENLIRIAGTGSFYNRINENSPDNSLFSKILKSGKPVTNIEKLNSTCINCPEFSECRERGNVAYPIKVENETIGVISFAAFNDEQGTIIIDNCDEYIKIMQQMAGMIEKEIVNIKITNKLNIEVAEVNEVINSINKGILIYNSEERITHINSKALKILDIDLSGEKIIGKKINDIITNFNIKDTQNKEINDTWKIGDKLIKVVCAINDLVLNSQRISTLVSFDELREIINIAFNYTNENNIDFSSIIGKSENLMRVIEKAKIASQSESTIMLLGESGTGKELFARAIHNESLRRKEPFVAVNCASIPENLLESELFGYEKGAFTGADTKGRIGKFELANNGTIFLDEIGDLPIHLQPKLLRAVQQKEIVRIGGNIAVKINARIISATHVDIESLVANKGFRQDLFYRLNVIPLKLPPLRDRGADILICSEYFLKKHCDRMGIEEKWLSKDVEQSFLTYEWQGNIREMENVLEYAVTFSRGKEIMLADLPDYFHLPKKEGIKEFEIFSKGGLEKITNEFQKNMLKKYISIYGSSTESKKNIAKMLGISLTTLYRKLQDYGIWGTSGD